MVNGTPSIRKYRSRRVHARAGKKLKSLQSVPLLLDLVGEVRRTSQGVKLKRHSSVSYNRQNACQAAFVSRGFHRRCQTLTAAGLSASLSNKPCPR
jgi:hypothetical protein